MRNKLFHVLGVLVLGLAILSVSHGNAAGVGAVTPVTGKIIALDAGHGGAELGAQYPADSGSCANDICEKNVNLWVVLALEEILTANGAKVVLTRETDLYMPTRRERVQKASVGCKEHGRECDALISVHHNGSTNASHDGMLVIYTQKQDFALAQPVHDALLSGMSYPPGGSCSTHPYSFRDERYIQGGYGMTKTPMISILTEGYYITNDCEAQYLLSTGKSQSPRIQEEAQALYAGIAAYFSSLSTCTRRNC